jgi:hypothetical protein
MKLLLGSSPAGVVRDDLGDHSWLSSTQPSLMRTFHSRSTASPAPEEDVLLTPVAPLFGHPSGRKGLTHWLVFMKL